MKKKFNVAGIGISLGNIIDCETFAESIITKSSIKGLMRKDALHRTISEAFQFTKSKNIPVLSNTELLKDVVKEFELGELKICSSFLQMFETIEDEALLVLKRKEGYVAIHLNQQDKGLAQVEVVDNNIKDSVIEEDFLKFVTATLEIRYAIYLNKEQKSMYRFWDSFEPRKKDIVCSQMKIRFEEPRELANKIYDMNKYILPVSFTTLDELKIKLNNLKQNSKVSMYESMLQHLQMLSSRNENVNTVVLLAENADVLSAQIDDFMSHEKELLSKGFVWKSKNGSMYICRSAKSPQIVYMNLPGGMFNDKTFYKFYFKLYGALKEASRFETDSLFTGRNSNFLDRALFDNVVNGAIVGLLEAIGIKPDIHSGACQGELNMELPYIKKKNSHTGDKSDLLKKVAKLIELGMREDKEPLEEYLGRKVDDFAKYYLKYDVDKVRKLVDTYDSVYMWITGSTKDVIICGEKAACMKIIKELGCFANEMLEPLYIHTPILEKYREELRSNLLKDEYYLDVDNLPFKIFSTFYLDYMTSEPEMFVDNFLNLIIKEVDYSLAIEKLYKEEARVFIDLSTMQLCSTWAKETLDTYGYNDANVLSIYGDGRGIDLLKICAIMIAGNVSFDYNKFLSILNFKNDVKEDEIEFIHRDFADEKNIHEDLRLKNDVRLLELQQYIKSRTDNNSEPYREFLNKEDVLCKQILKAMNINEVSVEQGVALKKDEGKKASMEPHYIWNREEVITMTDNSMAAVLGDKYKEVDKYPVRARMPLPPFLFVSRIVDIDAEYGELNPSASIAAEYDFDEECVFSIGYGNISNNVAIEASHIGIFLMGYMGLDTISNGTLSFRALDNAQTYYNGKPFKVGDTMKTVFKINRFAKNGSTTIMFYTYETYNGDELVSVSEASGGFFTKAELESNKGIITPKIMLKKVEPKELLHYSNTTKTSYTREETSAFYRGDYDRCFGKEVEVSSEFKYYLKDDIRVIDKVTNIDYNGGKYGRGIICGEKNITPDMWPFEVHFKNDPVFPGIIMLDGVMQLSMFLLGHTGILGQYNNTEVEIASGSYIKTKFRGQVRKENSLLRYELHIKDCTVKEDGMYMVTDAAIYNGHVQVIQVEDYQLRVYDNE